MWLDDTAILYKIRPATLPILRRGLLRGPGRTICVAALFSLTIATGCGTTLHGQTTADSAGDLASDELTFDPIEPNSTSGPAPLGEGRQTSSTTPSTVAESDAPTTQSSGSVAPSAKKGTTEPIKVGVLTTDYSATAKAFGYNDESSFGPQNAFRAVIKTLNEEGGLAGRKIEPVFHERDNLGYSYEAGYQAACATFTQDNHVEVVLAYPSQYSASFSSCLTDARISRFGGWTLDVTGHQEHPGYFYVDKPSLDRRFRAMIGQAVSIGFLSSDNKVGVLVEACPPSRRAFERTIIPLMRSHGITVIESEKLCPNGLSNVNEYNQSIQQGALRLQTEGADRVMLAGDNGGYDLQVFANQAESQGWRPGYITSTNDAPEGTKALIPTAQRENMIGSGWSPWQDVGAEPPPVPEAQGSVRKECLRLAQESGLAPGSRQDEGILYRVCDPLFMLRASVVESGGDSSYTAVSAAMERLESSVVGQFVASTRFGPERHDGAEQTAVYSYKSKCECFTYDTAPQPIPEL